MTNLKQSLRIMFSLLYHQQNNKNISCSSEKSTFYLFMKI